MILWTAVNSVAIVFAMLALYLTIRQVGLLLTHLGPGGARTADLGPRMGENISPFIASLPGDVLALRERTLFIFATEFCPACAAVRQAAQVLARHWASSALLVMVYDTLPAGANGTAGQIGNFRITAHPTLREKLDIRAVPYAVVTDGDGAVLGHGLVNSASHVESLLEVKGGQEVSGGPKVPAPAVAEGLREGVPT